MGNIETRFKIWKIFQGSRCKIVVFSDAEKDVLNRLLKKIDINPETHCWEFTGEKNTQGYGRIHDFWGKRKLTHRIMAMAMGIIRDFTFDEEEEVEDKYVLHQCDNPPCCNPNHLRAGTLSQNTQEAWDRNRKSYVPFHKIGEEVHNSKLTEKQVREIFFDERTQQVIADEYGVDQKTISNIKRKKIWRHIWND